MQSCHAGQQLITNAHCLGGFQLTELPQAGIEGLALQQSHAQEEKGGAG